jgi:hypothetical protein
MRCTDPTIRIAITHSSACRSFSREVGACVRGMRTAAPLLREHAMPRSDRRAADVDRSARSCLRTFPSAAAHQHDGAKAGFASVPTWLRRVVRWKGAPTDDRARRPAP